MSTLLLDASVILAAFDPRGEYHDACRAILGRADATLATLDLVRYELANVAVRAWRAPDQVGPLLQAVDRIAEDGGVVESTTALLTHAAQLAEEHTISAYDAAYVAAAAQAGAALVSCDIRDLVGGGLAQSPAGVSSRGTAGEVELLRGAE